MSSKKLKQAHIETRSVHAGSHPDPETGAVMPPIYQTSTYAQEAPGKTKGYDYSRAGNPTRDRLEEALASLEKAKYGLSFSAGLASIDAVIRMFDPGSHIVVSGDVYGGTYRLFTKHFSRFGFEFSFVNTTDIKEVKQAVTSKTVLLWLETPSNPLLSISDIAALTKCVKQVNRRCLVAVDNTFATPVLQNPLELGADIVSHSTTKYLGGHSDVIGGALMTNSKKLYEELKFVQFAVGAVPGPWDAWLTLRGIKTLAIRMDRHSDNAEKIAKFLEGERKVSHVYYPGLKNHFNHKVAKKQMCRFGGMISFVLKSSLKASEKFVSSRKFFTLAESLGGVESLIEHPASMTHASIPAKERRAIGLDDGLIRLSVGIENVDDLIDDLREGIKALK